MALYQMCSVLDMVAGQYGRPFFTVSEGSAIRSFSDEVNKASESVLYQHPNDFQLFFIGIFDDETCEIKLADHPRLLVSGANVAERPDPLARAATSGPEAMIADLSPASAAKLNGMRGARHG